MQEETILQIEDDEDVLEFSSRIFTDAGYHFFRAKTIEAGLLIAKEKLPALIILDYLVGDRTAIEFMTRLSNEQQYAELPGTPIILLSGRSDLMNVLEAYFDQGLRAVLKKPFGMRELLNVVDNILRLERARFRNCKSSSLFRELPPRDDEWWEEVSLSAETIVGLSREIYMNSSNWDTEKGLMDVFAIYNSSMRLVQLIQKKMPADTSLSSAMTGRA